MWLPYSQLASKGFLTVLCFLNPSPMWFICPSGISKSSQEYKDKSQTQIRAYIHLLNYSVFQGAWKGKNIKAEVTWAVVAFHGTSSWCLENITSRIAWTGGRIRTRSYSWTYLLWVCLFPSQIHLYSWPPQYPVAMSYLIMWYVPQFCSPFSVGEINIL